MPHPIVVVGAGLAGWTTVREVRKLNATTAMLLVTADSGDFYSKPSLSNALAQRRLPAQLVITPALKMAQTLAVTLHANTAVLSIDSAAQTIVTSNGLLHYSKLVLATGALPIRVPLAGNAADEVLSVNGLAHFCEFHARLTELATVAGAGAESRAKHVLIMGAGLIGCEFANDLVAAGHRVTVVDPGTAPIAALLPAQASAQLQDALSDLGVAWCFGSTVKSVNRIAAKPPQPGHPTVQVKLSNGQWLRADLVLSAIGLRADTALAQAAGMACERGVLVDTHLQTGCLNIYALGDIAQYASAGNRTLSFVMPIISAAKALAATLTGTPTELIFASMPVVIKTPALPMVVSAPAPQCTGTWSNPQPGVWHFLDMQGMRRGFVLAGTQTSRRLEQTTQLAA